MKKRFNDTGICIPEKHYMADISHKTAHIAGMIEKGDYFVINRPRQYGKTTTIYMLTRLLKASADYYVISTGFEGLGEDSYKSEAKFIEEFLLRLGMIFKMSGDNALSEWLNYRETIDSINKLGLWFTELVMKIGKKVVLIIDEVDQSCNNRLFLDFLGMLRDKYLRATQGADYTFHSVILAGVHDVKSLKIKIRDGVESKHNSPWNIAVDFNVEMSFNPDEIAAMLEDYTAAESVEMDIKHIAEKLYYFTSGYPYLVSKLCKIISEEIIVTEGRHKWQPGDIEKAVNKLLTIRNTNFESVVKNLENNDQLYRIVEKMVLFAERVEYNLYSNIVNMGIMYGIFKQEGAVVDIHNRVYKELICNYMATNFRLKELLNTDTGQYNYPGNFVQSDGGLDFEKVLLKFQEFMKKEYSRRDEAFLERNGRLIFLAFLKPIINGKGYDFKEPQVSEEKRLDVMVTYGSKKYVVELKIWRGQEAHKDGLKQLSDYLDILSLDKGYLVIFDFTRKGRKEFKKERAAAGKKDILAVWV
ncbi:MAG: AAA family ATPase [bacterium]|nr:AAA family ATPase [bacterium]